MAIEFVTPKGARVSIDIERSDDGAYDAVVYVNGRRHFQHCLIELAKADWGWCLLGVTANGKRVPDAGVGVPESHVAAVKELIAEPTSTVEDRQEIGARRIEFYRSSHLPQA